MPESEGEVASPFAEDVTNPEERAGEIAPEKLQDEVKDDVKEDAGKQADKSEAAAKTSTGEPVPWTPS